MRTKLLDRTDGRRAYVAVMDEGDEVVASLMDFAKREALIGSHLTAIGALSKVVLGWWNPRTAEYERIPVDEQVEVVSMAGNFALAPDGAHPKLHAHLVVAKSNGSAFGGHLLEAHVRPTLEVVVIESPTHLQRQIDPRTGLALLAP